jgi:hypothetical protein
MIPFMLFGKYRGRNFSEIPTDYLEWLLTIDLKWGLREAVEAEVRTRRQGQERGWTTVGSIAVPENVRDAVLEIVHAGFASASLKRHPYHGGTNEGMRQLLEARSWLTTTLGLGRSR